jgi:glutamate-1-semialdehyde 2,1-aminomutase
LAVLIGEQLDFTRTKHASARLARLVPGGGHTYSKGADQYPEESPGVLSHGLGCRVWDLDGNEFIEYGMGLRAVSLGHAYPEVVEAVRRSLALGTNFSRPAHIELECGEKLASMVGAEMVKFTKDGSTATSAALKLARKATGRDMVAMCADNPFFSYDDWFISTTTMSGGIRDVDLEAAVGFAYNDLDSLRSAFAEHPGRIAAVILEPARLSPPELGFLEGVRALCSAEGAVLIFDEMITGFRYHLRGAQALYGVRPDLSTWGKALANGFSVSALTGTADLMRLGSRERPGDDVFLLSTTHGAEICSLAAAIATMEVYEREPVIEHLYRQGERLEAGFKRCSERHGLKTHVWPSGFASNLLFSTRDDGGRPSQALRTLFLQELTRRGVLAPSLVVSYSHTDDDIDATIEAIDGALGVYAQALESGVDRFLIGRPSITVSDRRWAPR